MNSAGVFFLAFVTSILTAIGSVYVIQRYQLLPGAAQGASVAVPNLRGLSEAEARSNLRALGLVYLSAPREASTSVKPGSVVRQSIPPGQPIPREHPVTVVLAEELPKVPNVVGVPEAEAVARLERAGYRAQKGDAVPSPNVPDGNVAEQNPPAELPLQREQSVIYRMSSGQALVEMPKLIGKTVDAAKLDLEKLGLKPTIRWTSVAETATFVVLGQKPEAKTQVKVGSDVDLVANR
jgi:serine/threonine-protein kinase